MQTTVNIDESLLRQANEQAKKHGKSLDSLLEEALRTVVTSAVRTQSVRPENLTTEGLEPDDAFFVALDQIRSAGRNFAPHRQVELPQ